MSAPLSAASRPYLSALRIATFVCSYVLTEVVYERTMGEGRPTVAQHLVAATVGGAAVGGAVVGAAVGVASAPVWWYLFVSRGHRTWSQRLGVPVAPIDALPAAHELATRLVEMEQRDRDGYVDDVLK